MLKFANFVTVLVATAFLLAVGNCLVLNDTKNCSPKDATGELHSISIEPCSESPCGFESFKNYTYEMVFSPNAECRGVTAVVTVLWLGIVVRQETIDLCPYLHIPVSGGVQPGCPTDATQKHVIKYLDTIPALPPGEFEVTVKIELYCEPKKEVILCLTLPARKQK